MTTPNVRMDERMTISSGNMVNVYHQFSEQFLDITISVNVYSREGIDVFIHATVTQHECFHAFEGC